MNTFTEDQTHLRRVIIRRACVLRDLNYPHEPDYPEQSAAEVVRFDAAIEDIKTRLTKDEINACL